MITSPKTYVVDILIGGRFKKDIKLLEIDSSGRFDSHDEFTNPIAIRLEKEFTELIHTNP